MPVTRFAPSPTGLLHLGHAYSAWLAYQACEGGSFYLRMEDIDQGRCRPEYVESIYEDLNWLGIEWNGEVLFQSERVGIYREVLGRLKEMGVLYPCFCTRKEILEEVARIGSAPHDYEGPIYPGTCRRLDSSEAVERIEAGEDCSFRLDMEKAMGMVGELTFYDRGVGVRVDCHPERLGDVVLARKDSGLSYHLCCVVDDEAQGIELVPRGRDLFDATYVQRVLQELLGYREMEYMHHPLVVDEGGVRLAKRADSVSVRSLRESGKNPGEVIEMAEKSLERENP